MRRAMIERIEFDGDLYAKINEIIDHLNKPANKLVKEAYEQGLADARELPKFVPGYAVNAKPGEIVEVPADSKQEYRRVTDFGKIIEEKYKEPKPVELKWEQKQDSNL